MKAYSKLFGHYSVLDRLKLLDEAGEGEGGGTKVEDKPGEKGGDNGKPAERYFTQAQLNHILNEHKKTLREENAGLKTLVEAQGKQFDELKTLFSERVPKKDDTDGGDDEGEGDGKTPKDEKGRFIKKPDPTVLALQKTVEDMQKKTAAEIAKANKEIEDAKNVASSERQRRLNAERDKDLADALSKRRCSDIKNAVKLFKDDIQYDNEQEKWFYKDPESGEILSVDEGVEKNLPDYLKQPKNSGGGSGGAGASGAANQGTPEALEVKRKEMQKLQGIAEQTQADSDLARYSASKREFQKMEKELKK